MPHAVLRRGDLLDGPAGCHALRLGLDDRPQPARRGLCVSLLDEKPAALVATALPPGADLDECPASMELLAIQRELQRACAIGLVRVADRLPGAAIPDKHSAAAVLALGDDALEVAVLDRVILDVHGQPLVRGIEARPLGDRPALENAFELEPKIVVEPRGGVLLNHERARRRAGLVRHLTRRLGCFLEIALATILVKPHELIFPRRCATVHRSPLAARPLLPERPMKSADIGRGAAAGLLGGLLAAGAMSLAHQLLAEPSPEAQAAKSAGPEDPTIKVVSAGSIVHYAFGAVVGALYVAVAWRRLPRG